jgi:putative ABC transport system permease protein
MSVPFTRRHLFHETGKLILSIAGVAASLSLILLLFGFREGLYATLAAYVDHLHADLIVAQRGVKGLFSSDSAIPLAGHNDAVQAAGAVEAGHILLADVIFTHGETKTPILLAGYDPESQFGSPWKLDEGRLLEADGEILLDSWLAQRAGLQTGDEVEVLGDAFQVVGLTRETASWMSPYAFITLDAAADVLGVSGTVTYHLLRLPDGADVGAAGRAIEARVRGVNALTPADIAKADQRILATVMDVPINVMLAIGTVIGIAVMGLTAYTAVTDKMREYGTLKAVGAGHSRLTRWVVADTLARALLGYTFGIGVSYLAATLIMARWPQFNILIQIENLIQVGVLALFMSLAAALFPLRRLAKLDPLIVFKE